MKDKILKLFQKSKLEIKNENRLLDYIIFCLDNNTIKGETEEHHILPRNKNCFPEYENLSENEWNKSTLSYENHYIAHSILCEAVDNDSIYYAWNRMNNIKNKFKEGVTPKKLIGEKLYAENRKKHKDIVINYNKTRIITDSHREKMSKIMKEKLKGKTFFDTTGLITVKNKELDGYIQIPKENYDKKIHETFTSGKITAKDWDGNTFQINKDDKRYLSGEIGGVTANRCIFISPDGKEYRTMNIKEQIKILGLAPIIKNYKNKGIITYQPTASNKSRYNSFIDINGWEIKVLDKPIIKGKYKK